MAKTEEGKELERLFKNQETPEESKRKMEKGFSELEVEEAKVMIEEFVAKPFQEIYEKALTYAKKAYNTQDIRLRSASCVRNFFHGVYNDKHCHRRRIYLRVYYRNSQRESYLRVSIGLSVCPCCGNVKRAG